MPFCEDCSRFWSPNSLRPDGACPTCGRAVATKTDQAPPKAPWHFKLMVLAVAAYLAWRAWDLLALLF